MSGERMQATFASGDIAGKDCSICLTKIISGDSVVSCPHCSMPFHSDCWEENGGCSVYGCKSAPHIEKENTVSEFMTSNVWAEDKNCPACGRLIKAQALKCKFCGATFSTRDAISIDTYENRPYEGREYIRARNCVIGAFLLSAVGCLAPIMLFATGFLIFFGSLGFITFRRLNTELKTIVYIIFGLNILMLLLLMGLFLVE